MFRLKSMHRPRVLFISLVMICAMQWSTPALAVENLVASSWMPSIHLLYKEVLGGWAKNVEQASEGRVKVRILKKAVAKPPGTFDAVRGGQADVSFIVHGYTPGRFVLTKMPEFPGMGNSSKAMSVAYQRIHERYLAPANEHGDSIVVLAVWVHGPGNIYNTKRAVKRVSDLSGLKIRVGGGVVNSVGKDLGVSVILKPAPLSYEIINSGVADGVFFPAETIPFFKLDKLVKYATIVPGGLYNVSFAMIMNKRRFERLSDEDQRALLSVSGEKLAALAGESWDRADVNGRQKLSKTKVKVITADQSFLDDVNARTEHLYGEWYREANKRGVNAKQVQGFYRAEVRRMEG